MGFSQDGDYINGYSCTSTAIQTESLSINGNQCLMAWFPVAWSPYYLSVFLIASKEHLSGYIDASGNIIPLAEGETIIDGETWYYMSSTFNYPDNTSNCFISDTAFNAAYVDAYITYMLSNVPTPQSGTGTATVEIDIEGETLTFESQSLGNTITRFINDDATIDMEE